MIPHASTAAESISCFHFSKMSNQKSATEIWKKIGILKCLPLALYQKSGEHNTVAWKGSPLIFQFLDFLALGKNFRHTQVSLKVIASYKVYKALKLIWEVGGLNPQPLRDGL